MISKSFFSLVGFPFILLMVYFAAQKLFSLKQVHFFFFFFWLLLLCALGFQSNKIIVKTHFKEFFFPVFCPSSFMV